LPVGPVVSFWATRIATGDDPAERAKLIERFGPEEYSRALKARWDSIIIATVSGHASQKEAANYAKRYPNE